MIPQEVFKRRHHGTPQSFSLIITNSIVICLIVPTFVSCKHISWVFWAGIALLAIYNFFTIRRNREEFNKPTIIAYVISIAIFAAIIVFFALKDC